MSRLQHVRYQLQAGGLDIMGLQIHNLIYSEFPPQWSSEPHVHDFWQLCLYKRNWVIFINGVEEEISDTHVAIIRPYDEHCFRMPGDGTTTAFEIKWQFSPSLADCFSPPQWSGIFRDHYGLRLYVKQAIDELVMHRHNWELMLRSIIFGMLVQIDRALLAEIQRIGEEQPPQGTYLYRHMLIHKAKKYVQDRLDQQITIRDTARELCISPDYLTKLFKIETGQSFAQWVIEQKLAFARRVLATTTEMPVSEVARCIGYEDSRYFSRLFKAKTGATPTDYRYINQQDDETQTEV